MSNPVSFDIKDYLVAQSFGTFASTSSSVWGIFCVMEPEKNKKSITIVDTVGFKPLNTINRQTPTRREGFMVKVRDIVYTTAWTKLDAIGNKLDNTYQLTINSQLYDTIVKQGDINYLGVDENSNHMFSLNFLAYRRVALT